MPFLNNDRLTTANNAAKEKLATKAPILPAGVHTLVLSKMELRPNKSNGNLHFDLELTDPSGTYRPLLASYAILPPEGGEAAEYMDINLKILAGIFLDGYDHEMRNGDTKAEFFNQFGIFKGKKAQFAIYHQMRVMNPQDRPDELMLFEEPNVWYAGNINNEALLFDATKAKKPLRANELSKWQTWPENKRKVAKGIDLGAATSVNARPTQAAAPKAAAVAKAAEPEEEEEVDGDVSFDQ